MSESYKKQKSQSYLSSHPQISKVIASKRTQTGKFPIPQKQYIRKKTELYSHQQAIQKSLQERINVLQNDNEIFKQSLEFFDAELILQQLQRQLQSIKQEESTISEKINHCQIIEQNTTPEEYFLFKKNKRLQTFNEAIEELFEQVNLEKQQMKRVMDEIKSQSSKINSEISQMEGQLNTNKNFLQVSPYNKDHESQSNSSKESRRESQINVIVQSNRSSVAEKQHKEISQEIDSDSSSSVDYTQLEQLNDQYKNLLQTYEIISENKEIMTTQLLNNISSIEDSINKYYQNEKTKLFRDIMQVKQDFQYMPVQHIIPPTESQLGYDVAPLITDYKNKLADIGKKLSPDLKNITLDILLPLRWDAINFDQYFEISQTQNSRPASKSIRQTQKSSQTLKQTQKDSNRLEQLINSEDQSIHSLELNLQQIMSETMMYKQKQHQLELAMNNMRKMIKQQSQLF